MLEAMPPRIEGSGADAARDNREGPHALAIAALLPERTTRAAVLVGIAPHGADGLDWFDGMAHSNVMEFTAAANGYENIVAHTKAVAGPS